MVRVVFRDDLLKMAARLSGEDLYALSYELLGHSSDVRSVKYCPVRGSSTDHFLLTASRDGTACVWEPEGISTREYVLRKVVKKHTGFVTALCVIPPENNDGSRNETLFATGGQDNTILFHSLQPEVETPLKVYVGHKATVSCIIYQCGQLISASWDSTVRVWSKGGDSVVLEAHKPAVWGVAGLHEVDGSNRILSCGADKVIRLWEVNSKLCVLEYRGHRDVVRDVKVASLDTFYSAANDCVIRKWNLHNGYCLNEISGHRAFVYSLCVFPGSGGQEFVSCGEDGTIRVWQGVACVQVIEVPAVSVWTICLKENGDIMSGSSDGVARIFSRSKELLAPRQELETYKHKLTEARSTAGDAIDVSKYPGPEALSIPGERGGATKVINNKGTPEVYQWSDQDQEWVLIGNAIGKVPDGSSNSHSQQVFNDKEYDFVFDIELDEGSSNSMKKLRLPYNRTMDPYMAAEEFIDTHHLPSYYLDQVAEFIIKNAGEYRGDIRTDQGDPLTGGSRYIPGGGRGGGGSGTSDPFTGGSRYQPGGGGGGGGGDGSASGGGFDPFTGGSSYRPSEYADNKPSINVSFKGAPKSNTFFPMSAFKLFTSSKDYCEKILGKVAEFNSSGVVDQKDIFSEEQLKKLNELCILLMSLSGLDPHSLSLVEVMLNWPSQCVFPGLDLIRLVLISADGCTFFIGNNKKGHTLLETLLQFASDQSQPKNQVPVLRALANFFAQETGVNTMHAHRRWILNKLMDFFSSTNRTNQIALSTIILNYCHYYRDKKDDEPEAVVESCHFAVQILKSSYDLEAKFRAALGVGSLLLGSTRYLVLSAISPADLKACMQPLTTVQDPIKVSQCSKCVLELLEQ